MALSTQLSGVRASVRSQDAPLIFVVDDEVMIGEVVEAILNLEGYNSKFFNDPREALNTIIEQPHKPDLLLSDFVMTPLNGMELIEKAKLFYPGLRTILYSGNVSEEITSDYRFKPDRFISKPFLPKTLVALVREVLALRGS